MLLWWGKELATLYNDACRPLFGAGHPQALGGPARDVLPAGWGALTVALEHALATGQRAQVDDLALLPEREGCREERYFSLSCSPIRDELGRVAGLLSPAIETTARAIGERRRRTLGALAALERGESVVAACTAAAAALAGNPRDLPFALFYVLDRERGCARLASVSGIAPGGVASPQTLALDNPGSEWPLARLSREPRLETQLNRRFPGLPTGAWECAPDKALLLPLAISGEPRALAVLIAALNPHRPLDEDYRQFLDLAARRIAAAFPARRTRLSHRRRDWTAVAKEGRARAVPEDRPIDMARPAEGVAACVADGARSLALAYSQDTLAALGPCLGADVSKCTQVERALRESEARLRLFIDYAPVAVAMLDRHLRYLAVSRRWLDDYGLDDRIHGLSHDRVLPEIPERWKAIYRRALTGEGASCEEDRFERADGSVQWLHWRVHPWRNAEGAIGGIVIFTEDITARKRAEEEASASRATLEAALSSMSDAVLVCDAAGRFVRFNPVFPAFHRFSNDTQCPRTLGEYPAILDLQGADGEPIPFDCWPTPRALRGEAATGAEYIVRRKDTGESWSASYSYAPIRDAAGIIVGSVVVGRDVTGQKRSEEALRRALLAAAEERGRILDAIFEHVPEGITLADAPDGRIRTVSRYGRELLGEPQSGTTAEDAIRRCTVFHSDGTTPMAERDLPRCRALRGEVVRDCELIQIDPQGRRLYLSCNAGPVYDRAGDLVGAVEAWRDIGARKLAEAALSRSEELNRETLQALPAAIAVIDREGTILAVNEAWTGFAASVAGDDTSGLQVGSNYLDVCQPASMAKDAEAGAALAGIRAVLDGVQRQFSLEYLCETPKGPLWLLMTVVPLGPAARHGAVVSHLDVTARRLAEEGLRLADRRKDEFLATLAHELRNPLAPLRNIVDMLGKTFSRQPVDERLHAMMKRQVDHMVRLVDDLLEIARISRGKLALKRERVELASVVLHAMELSQPLIESGRHELLVDLPTDPIVLDADPVRLAQVLANLLNNAAKYTPAGGRIRLAGRLQDGQAVVSVRDDGVGIAAEMLPRVFDLFTQVEGSLESAQGGLGIGLALVRALTELHGGSVEARSEGPGRGSELVLRLPLAEPVAGAAYADGEAAAASIAGRRILVADDHADVADSLGMLLGTLGAEVRVVYDGAAALRAFEAEGPDALFLDIGMPGMDGCEVARRVRARCPDRDLLVVAVTGWGDEEKRRRLRSAGFDRHLVKPASLESLTAVLAGRGSRP